MKSLRESLSRPRLSVAMIVRDEQEVLAESIEGIRRIADEIVILDTGSADRTPELAAQLGTAVHRRPWENDFSASRNHCLRFLGGNWVLWLDAGERIRAEQAAELRRFLNERANPSTAYSFWVESPPRQSDASAEQCANQAPFHPPGLAVLRPSSGDAGRLARAGRRANRRGALPHFASSAAARRPAAYGQGPARLGVGYHGSGSLRKLVAAVVACGRPGPQRAGR